MFLIRLLLEMTPIALVSLVLSTISSSLLFERVAVDSTKILYVSYIGCKSTFSTHRAITKILLDSHHEITAISPLPFDQDHSTGTHPNYTNLEAYDDFYQFSDQFSIDDELTGTYSSRKLGYDIQIASCANIYRNTKVVETLKKINVDLILLEMDAAECYFPLLAHLQVPVIGVSTQNILFPDFDGLLGNSANPSYVPSSTSGFSSRMNLFQRLLNAKDYALHWAIGWYYSSPPSQPFASAAAAAAAAAATYRRREIFDRISLVFSNGHRAFLPKPLAPNTVDIAGIHIGKPSPLPEKIRSFIENSTKQVVYLSLGSVTKFSGLPQHVRDSFVKVLEKLEYRVIWRHDKPEMVPNSLGNFLVEKWLPQTDILAHSKVIMFISHGGIFSTYEAIHYGVPMLAFPVLYDQFTNAAVIESLEIGIVRDLRSFDETKLASGIEEVIENNKYRKNIRKFSKIFKDRPSSAQETVLYWVDYVSKHKDVSYLKPAAAELPFHQYLLLDVILFAIAILFGSSWIIYITTMTIVSLFKNLFFEKCIKKKKINNSITNSPNTVGKVEVPPTYLVPT